MRTSSWLLPILLSLGCVPLLQGCGEDASPPKEAPAAEQPANADAEAAGARERLPPGKTGAPIRLTIGREDNLAVWGHPRKVPTEEQWIYYGHFDKNRAPDDRAQALIQHLRAEADRRPRSPSGASKATLEIRMAQDVRCVSLFAVILGAVSHPKVRITRFWFRTSGEDEGVRLELAQDVFARGDAPHAPRVNANLTSGGEGKPDVVFLVNQRDHTFTIDPAAPLDEAREALAAAWAVWKEHWGRGKLGSYMLGVPVHTGSGQPWRAWSAVRLLQAAQDLGFGSIQWGSPPPLSRERAVRGK